MQIPFGTAVGYAYGGFISKHLSWEWMFRLEVLPMLPLIAMIWFMPYNMTRRIVTEEVSAALAADTTSGDAVIADGVSPKAAAAYASSSGSAAASVAPAKAGKAGKSGKGKSAAEEELLAGLRDGEPGAVAHTPTHAAAAGDAGARATHLSVHGKQHYAHHVPPTAAEVNRCVNQRCQWADDDGDVDAEDDDDGAVRACDAGCSHSSCWLRRPAIITALPMHAFPCLSLPITPLRPPVLSCSFPLQRGGGRAGRHRRSGRPRPCRGHR